MRIIPYALVLVLFSSMNAVALRSAPASVPPVQKDGVEYRVNHDRMGVVEAWDTTTQRKLWSVQVYKVAIRKWMEEDVQWVFITDLTLDGNNLIVENENKHVFRVDLSTQTVSSSDCLFIEALPMDPEGDDRIDVTVQLMVLSFSQEVIDKLLTKGLTVASLMNEWGQGRASLISAPIMTTSSGKQTTIKAVREHIYPTELSWSLNEASATSVSNSVQFVVPSDFQTREVGIFVSLLPEYIAASDAIDLVLDFEYLPEPEWRTYYGATNSPQPFEPPRIDQPIFRPLRINMSAQMPNGEPCLLAGGVDTSDGKSLVYIIATATTAAKLKK